MNIEKFVSDMDETNLILKSMNFTNNPEVESLTKEQLETAFIAHQYILMNMITILDRLTHSIEAKYTIGAALIAADFEKLNHAMADFSTVLNDKNYHLLHHFMDFVYAFMFMFPDKGDMIANLVAFMDKFRIESQKQEEEKMTAVQQAEELLKNLPKK